MPRAKEFDEAEVLDQALELFRARGFKHTSFADLVAELGVSRQSLYDTYGDKQALFEAALRRYSTRALEFVRRQLDDPRPIRVVLGALFERLIGANCVDKHSGCLMANSMVELSPHDATTRALAQAYVREFEGVFVSRLSAAQRNGDLSRDKDPVALARYFYHTLLGLSVSARALGEQENLRQTARLALQVLD